MADIALYGPAYSVYTRIVRVVLEEKSVSYRLEEVDFISGGMPDAQTARHPFGMVPALEHGGETFFETAPVCTYLDEVFADPPFRPKEAAGRAHVAATIAVLDQYVWPDIRDLMTQALFAPLVGGWPDDSVVERMVKRLSLSLAVLEEKFVRPGRLNVDAVTLADLHAAPMIAYLADTVEGQLLLKERPALSAWWAGMKERPSLAATAFDLQAYPWARREMTD